MQRCAANEGRNRRFAVRMILFKSDTFLSQNGRLLLNVFKLAPLHDSCGLDLFIPN